MTPQASDVLTEEMLATAGRQPDSDKAVRAVRAVRRRELLRISAGDVLGLVDVADVGNALSRITDATLEATLAVVSEGVREQRELDTPPTRIAMIAMGRYGGFELSYGSDADVLFVHGPEEGVDPHEAASYAKAVAEEVRRTLALPGGDPPLVVDADLRPEGKQGPLVRTLDAYEAYYAKWSKVWEAQALLRADAVVGDVELRERFTALIDPLRYPEGGLAEDDIVEVRRIKSRVDNERLPRGADPSVHFKLGRGGLADIEWTVQLLQLRHGAEVAGLRTTQTLAALAAATGAGLLSSDDADVLAERVANGQPGAQRGHPRPRKIGRPDAAPITRTPRCSRDSGLFARSIRRDGERLSAGHATCPRGRRSSFLGMIDERSGGVTGSSAGCVMIEQSGRGRPPRGHGPTPFWLRARACRRFSRLRPSTASSLRSLVPRSLRSARSAPGLDHERAPRCRARRPTSTTRSSSSPSRQRGRIDSP